MESPSSTDARSSWKKRHKGKEKEKENEKSNAPSLERERDSRAGTVSRQRNSSSSSSSLSRPASNSHSLGMTRGSDPLAKSAPVAPRNQIDSFLAMNQIDHSPEWISSSEDDDSSGFSVSSLSDSELVVLALNRPTASTVVKPPPNSSLSPYNDAVKTTNVANPLGPSNQVPAPSLNAPVNGGVVPKNDPSSSTNTNHSEQGSSASSSSEGAIPITVVKGSTYEEMLGCLGQTRFADKFRHFLRSVYCEEYITFHYQIEELHLCMADVVENLCLVIYNEYVNPLGEHVINLNQHIVEKIQERIKRKEFSRQMFDEVHRVVLNLINSNYWVEFKSSKYCKEDELGSDKDAEKEKKHKRNSSKSSSAVSWLKDKFSKLGSPSKRAEKDDAS